MSNNIEILLLMRNLDKPTEVPIRCERPRTFGSVSIHAGIQKHGLFFDS
jgi:hypothetical protein